MNQLLGSQRMLTGPEPGLTRDANASILHHEGRRIVLTDTAGWLQHSSLANADAFGYAHSSWQSLRCSERISASGHACFSEHAHQHHPRT